MVSIFLVKKILNLLHEWTPYLVGREKWSVLHGLAEAEMSEIYVRPLFDNICSTPKDNRFLSSINFCLEAKNTSYFLLADLTSKMSCKVTEVSDSIVSLI